MKKVKIKFNKKTVLIVIISFVVLLLGIASFWFFNTDMMKKKLVKFNDEIAKNKLYDNYLISYLLMGDVKVSDEGIKADDGDMYYLVTDPIIKKAKINSLGDFWKLVEDNLSEIERVNYYISLDNTNTYISDSRGLFLKKGEKKCELIDNLKIDKKDFSYKKKDEYNVGYYKGINDFSVAFTQNKCDDFQYKLFGLMFACDYFYIDTDQSSINKQDNDNKQTIGTESTDDKQTTDKEQSNENVPSDNKDK